MEPSLSVFAEKPLRTPMETDQGRAVWERQAGKTWTA
jgi:hypothetical protein